MKVVVRKTGLSPHVIRVWEKRYGAVMPTRTETQRRLYTDADIRRLVLLRQATLAGYSIGQIADLPTDRLRELVAEGNHRAMVAMPTQAPQSAIPAAQSSLDACMAAVERLDATELETVLWRTRVPLSHTAFLDALIVPLMQQVGDRWRAGSLRVMHEHLASAVVRTLLGSLTTAPGLPETAPRIIVTTPAGQLHEIGALLVASIASLEGWRVTYLGPNLPAEDIAAAVQQEHARAVGLSVVYPPDDPHLQQELTRLRRYLASDVTIFAGGRSATGYHEVLQTIGVVRPRDLQEFRQHLETLRGEPTPSERLEQPRGV